MRGLPFLFVAALVSTLVPAPMAAQQPALRDTASTAAPSSDDSIPTAGARPTTRSPSTGAPDGPGDSDDGEYVTMGAFIGLVLGAFVGGIVLSHDGIDGIGMVFVGGLGAMVGAAIGLIETLRH